MSGIKSREMKHILVVTSLLSTLVWLYMEDIFAPGGVRWTNQLHQQLKTSSSIAAITERSLYILDNYPRFVQPKWKTSYFDEDSYPVTDRILLERASAIKKSPRIEIRVANNQAKVLYISWGALGIGIFSKKGQPDQHWYTREVNEQVYVYFDEH